MIRKLSSDAQGSGLYTFWSRRSVRCDNCQHYLAQVWGCMDKAMKKHYLLPISYRVPYSTSLLRKIIEERNDK